MAISKVIVNGVTKIDATIATATAEDIVSPKTAMLADGVVTIGTGTSGGGVSIDDFLTGEEPSGVINSEVTSLRSNSNLRNCTNLTGAYFPNLVSFPMNFLNDCTYLTVIFAPKASVNGNSYLAQGCQRVQTVVIGNANGCNYGLAQMVKSNSTALTKVDIVNTSAIGSRFFSGDKILNTIILRGTEIHPLNNTDAFNDSPFKSGGTGGTIYIPKVLYDKLGTGTDDYKASTNWGTVDGYGTITWAKIEGSQYENYYADGTPIPSE